MTSLRPLTHRCSRNASHIAAFVKYGLLGGKKDELAIRESHALFDQRVESFMTYSFSKGKTRGQKFAKTLKRSFQISYGTKGEFHHHRTRGSLFILETAYGAHSHCRYA